jgi:HAD superfamily hydrolase (TIGR01549 family)
LTGARQIAAVVFDLDGTLLDTMTSAPTAYARAIRDLGGPHLSPDEVVAAWHLGPTPAVLAHFLGRAVSPDDIECYFRHFEAAAAKVRPFPGVLEMVGRLAGAGYRLGIFTAATGRAARRTLAVAGLAGLFPAVVCGDEVAHPKPAPLGLQLACERLGVAPAQAAYVGDAEVDLRCAQAAGALGIHASWGAAARFHPAARRPADVLSLLRGLPS